MDEVAAPWRALEDPTPGTGGAEPAARDRAGTHPSGWVVGAVVGGGLLVLLAFWLAATSRTGTIGVEGAAAAVDAATADAGRSAPLGSPGPVAIGGMALVVDVQGAVVRPGVIHLSAGARVGDAIAAAGGYGPRVAADRVGRELNLAALLKDGDQIVVPSRDDVAPAAGGGAGTGSGATASSGGSPTSGPIDLNRATATELDALPGIGPVTANKIIAARQEQPFASVEDLRNRKVVGAATFGKIKDLVVVR